MHQRPLPLPPVVDNLTALRSQPWYRAVSRQQGESLLRNGPDGTFLVRPSSKGDDALTLTLWHRERAYNIRIRRRMDGEYALGTPKANEQHFSRVEDIIGFYQREELVLYSNGVETGRTVLKSLQGSS